jgi:iron complex transport system ATP-binding protein
MSALIQAVGLTVGHQQPALRGIDLSVGPREFVGLLGANGAGKSTLLMTLAGHLNPLEGDARLEGQAVAKLPPRKVARLLAYLPQHPAADGDFAVRDVVELGRHPYQRGFGFHRNPEDREAVSYAMRVTATEHLAGHRMDRLSGGQRQRVRLAQAIAQRPRVLLLDEPTSWLDLRYQLELMSLLRRLALDEGVAVVAVLHDLNQAAQFCTRVVLLAEGGVLGDGDPRDVLTAEALEKAYGVRALVQPHPRLGVPVVMPLDSLGKDET